MLELVRAARVVGWRQILDLYRATRVGWSGIISGFYTTRTMQALFNVGFFDELIDNGKINVTAFAEARGLDARLLDALCTSLFALRILARDGDDYVLDDKGELLTQTARGWFEGVYGYEDVLHHLEPLLRKEVVYGKEVRRRADSVDRGSTRMAEKIYFPLVDDLLAREGFRRVLDLGCGEGAFLRYLCRRRPDVVAHGFDLDPDAVTAGTAHIAREGLQDRIRLAVQDVSTLTRIPEAVKDIDVATVFLLLHELLFISEEAVTGLLQAFRGAFPGVPLVVTEIIRPRPEELRRRPGMGVHYYLHHDLSNQKPVGRDAWRTLFSRAGFATVEERHLGFARTSIFTLR